MCMDETHSCGLLIYQRITRAQSPENALHEIAEYMVESLHEREDSDWTPPLIGFVDVMGRHVTSNMDGLIALVRAGKYGSFTVGKWRENHGNKVRMVTWEVRRNRFPMFLTSWAHASYSELLAINLQARKDWEYDL